MRDYITNRYLDFKIETIYLCLCFFKVIYLNINFNINSKISYFDNTIGRLFVGNEYKS